MQQESDQEKKLEELLSSMRETARENRESLESRYEPGQVAEREEAEEQEPVNSYLLHEVLPLLELGLYPRLVDIDYDEFECYDPAALL